MHQNGRSGGGRIRGSLERENKIKFFLAKERSIKKREEKWLL
jgi:hypothetical protein